jgi:hypothetical protein
VIGTRIRDWTGSPLLAWGEYARHPNGEWFCCTPNGHLGGLAKHTVTEHDDGTITVSPSILVSEIRGDGSRRELWHGYLERGVWREV